MGHPGKTTGEKEKKVPVSEVQVGSAPPPDLKAASSSVGPENSTRHTHGKVNVKLHNQKMDFIKRQAKVRRHTD